MILTPHSVLELKQSRETQTQAEANLTLRSYRAVNYYESEQNRVVSMNIHLFAYGFSNWCIFLYLLMVYFSSSSRGVHVSESNKRIGGEIIPCTYFVVSKTNVAMEWLFHCRFRAMDYVIALARFIVLNLIIVMWC